MASMTDVIFLLLIFFMITSTIVFPNSIKVNLPQSNQQAAAKPLTRGTITSLSETKRHNLSHTTNWYRNWQKPRNTTPSDSSLFMPTKQSPIAKSSKYSI